MVIVCGIEVGGALFGSGVPDIDGRCVGATSGFLVGSVVELLSGL